MEKQVILRNYSYRERQCLCPSYFNGIIEFTVDGQINFIQGAFLTTNAFDSPQNAQEYLSITYCPSYLYEWKNDICSRLMQDPLYEFKNIYGKKNSASRIWPAFGHHGGGCEVIMTKGELKCPEAQILDGGGEDDFYHDSYMSDIIFCFRLVEATYKWFSEEKKKEDLATLETIKGKILDGLGFVFKWIGSKTGIRYAISCAYKEINNVTHLRFWGYVWEDNGNVRYLPCPIIKDYPFECPKKEIKSQLRRLGEIFKVLDSIHENLKNIACNFKNIDKLQVPLLKPNGFECLSG